MKILDRLADRMARVIGAVATFFNPELVVIGGAVAQSAGVLLEPIIERLKEPRGNPRWRRRAAVQDSTAGRPPPARGTPSAIDNLVSPAGDILMRELQN